MYVGNIIFFIVSWWIILFMLLPLKIKVSDSPTIGTASSAPIKSYLLIKVVITTILSAVFTALYVYLKIKGYVNFEVICDLITFM